MKFIESEIKSNFEGHMTEHRRYIIAGYFGAFLVHLIYLISFFRPGFFYPAYFNIASVII